MFSISRIPALIARTPPRRHFSTPISKGKERAQKETPTNGKNEGKNAADDLPFLQRPLGVGESPTTAPRTWKDSTDEMMDQNKRMEHRRHLVKEATKGYFADFNALRHHGGKTWVAPPRLIRAEQSLYLPDIEGVSLDGSTKHTTDMCKGRISVISILGTQMSELHANSFTYEANRMFLDVSPEAHRSLNYTPPPNPDPPPPTPDPVYQNVLINLQPNPLKHLLVKMFLSSLRKAVPQHLHATYLLSMQNLEYVQDRMGLTNKHLGYVYLVDRECKIRWAGCGMARPEESNSLRNCVQVLLGRGKGGTAGPQNLKHQPKLDISIGAEGSIS